MAQINDPDGLSQGTVNTVAATTFASQSGAQITITSANVPAVTVGDYIEVRDAANSVNDGLYVVDTYNAGVSIIATKQALTGAAVNPANDAGSATIRILGDNTDEKNVYFDTTNLLVTFLNGFGSVTVMSDDGVLGQAFYSFCKEEWKNDNDLIKFKFPMTAITPEQFEFNEWKPVDEAESTISTTPASNTRNLLRTAGWDEVDVNGFIESQYFCWITLGNIDATDNAYYFWDSATVAGDIGTAVFDQATNEAVQSIQRIDLSGAGTIAFVDGAGGNDSLTRTVGSWITDGVLVGDSIFIQNAEDAGNNGSFVVLAVTATDIDVATASFTANADDTTALVAIDHRTQTFTCRIRIFGKTYDQSSTTDIGVTALTNQAYRFPLQEAADPVITDLGVTEAQANGSISPYDDMNITRYATAQSRDGFNLGDNKLFGTIIDGDVSQVQEDGGGAATAEQIYAHVQAQLAGTTDIDAGAGTLVGQLADPLLVIASTGNTLSSILQVNSGLAGGDGVYVDSFSSADKNRVEFQDNSNVTQDFPLTVVITLNYSQTLVDDTGAVFKMFFTNDDAGDNTGRDFGTINAIIVQDDTLTDISGTVPSLTANYNYAYSANVQRGAASGGTDAPVTIVAIGLGTAQYVLATGTITNTGLTASLVAALERNFSNP
jgi:hypothetical protein